MEITPEMQAIIDKEVNKRVTEELDGKLEDAAKTLADSRLKDIKGKLDAAYGSRDEAIAKLKELEERVNEAQKAKDVELLKARKEARSEVEERLAETLSRVEALETRNTELSRQGALSEVLGTFQFKSKVAARVAREMLSAQIIQDEDGSWVSKTGETLSEFTKKTLSSEEHSFLLQPSVPTGTGQGSGHSAPGETNKPLLERSNEEILKRYM